MFVDRFRVTLSLAIGGETFSFPSGSIEDVDLEILPYRFAARVSFYVSSEAGEQDALFPVFTTDTLIQATLSVGSALLDATDDDTTALKVVGYVLEKSMREQLSDLEDSNPVIGRTYSVHVVDPAWAFWRQHHPLELHAGVSMQEVIELHRMQGMEITYDWSRLSEKQAVLCVSAGAEGEATFYDQVIWFVDRHGGVFELDATAGAYRIADGKRRPSSPDRLEKDFVASLKLLPAVPPRHAPRVLNAHSEAAQTVPIPHEQAQVGVHHDVLVRTAIDAVVARRVLVEATRLRPAEPELLATFARCPPQLHAPGLFLKLSDDFSDRLLPAGKTYRVTELHLQARYADVGEVADLEDEVGPFEATITTRLELASDPRPRLPPFTPPRYPVVVEGKLLSEGGEDEDRTWMMVTNEDDSIHQIRAEIPLWNRKIPAPFEPNRLPGHLFFPLYKHERVLVALHFDRASVLGHLGWAANARTPADGQGDRIALGLQASNGTVVDHIYQDSKPVLTVARTFGNDLQTLIAREGTLFLEVREDDSLAELTPRYDVTIVVTASKERLASEIQGAISGLTGSFESSVGETSATLEGATAELEAALAAAEGRLNSRIEAVSAELEALSSSLAAATEPVSSAVASAKAELAAALA